MAKRCEMGIVPRKRLRRFGDSMNTTLVVMAAGMGSRFGGLKQAEPLTSDGKCILDFTAYDAIKAGFDKVVFIIRKDIESDFKALVGDRITAKVPVEYVIQDTSVLPAGRTKPFGTGHAVLCCKDAVKGPFAIVNADDYYGSNAFYDIRKHLSKAERGEYAMTAYRLGNTVSDHGTVSRGVCELENGYLKSITERKHINSKLVNESDGLVFTAETTVSMNLWGLTPDIFDILQLEYDKFLKTANLNSDEFLINDVIFEAVRRGIATVKAFSNADKWYGITYRDDLQDVRAAIAELIAAGAYNGI